VYTTLSAPVGSYEYAGAGGIGCAIADVFSVPDTLAIGRTNRAIAQAKSKGLRIMIFLCIWGNFLPEVCRKRWIASRGKFYCHPSCKIADNRYDFMYVTSFFTITMTKFQAFCRGFWSAWDFTRPFSEKPTPYQPGEEFDIRKAREALGLNVGCWEAVGNHLYKVIPRYENEVKSDVPEQ
jgi:hypothetical protein